MTDKTTKPESDKKIIDPKILSQELESKSTNLEINSDIEHDKNQLTNEQRTEQLVDGGEKKKKKKRRKKKSNANSNSHTSDSSVDSPIKLHGHTDEVIYLSSFLEKNLIISSSLDKTIRLWDIRSGTSPVSVVSNSFIPTCIATTSGSFWCGFESGDAKEYDLRHLKSIHSCHISDDEINMIALQNNTLAAACDDEGKITVWETETGKIKRIFSKPHSNV